jgi:hypothetical protein
MSEPVRSAVVVTGCGWVTPLASGTISQVLAAGRSGQVVPPADQPYWPVAADLAASHPGLANELKRDKAACMTGVVFLQACQAAMLPPDTLESERAVGPFRQSDPLPADRRELCLWSRGSRLQDPGPQSHAGQRGRVRA